MIQAKSAAQRVLIVSAASGDVTPIISTLQGAGCYVRLVETIELAVQTARELNPTIVLVGDTTSGLNPLQVTMRIREVVTPGATPLFLITPTCQASDCDVLPQVGDTSDSDLRGVEESHEMNPGVLAMVKQIGDALQTQESKIHPPGTALTSNAIIGPAIVSQNVVAPDKAKPQQPDRIQCNGVCLDRVRHRVWLDTEEMRLTPTEFKLLWELVGRPGSVLTRDELALACRSGNGCQQSRTIDAHVKSIRRKLAEKSVLVETVHGVGYRFRDTEW